MRDNSPWQRVRYLFQVIAVACIFCQSHACNETEIYHTSSGINCRYCEAGFYLVADCKVHMENAVCERCPEGQFQPVCNHNRQCTSCSPHCPDRMLDMVSSCSSTADMDCQCKEGRYWLQQTRTEGVCLLHNTCPIGQGVFRKGTRTKDTECMPCVVGTTYSDRNDLQTCQNCTKCDVYSSNCSRKKDAKCSQQDTVSKGASLSSGVIAAIVCPSVAFLVSLVAIVCVCRWHQRNKQNKQRPDTFKKVEVGDHNNIKLDTLKDDPVKCMETNTVRMDGSVIASHIDNIALGDNLMKEPHIENQAPLKAAVANLGDSGVVVEFVEEIKTVHNDVDRSSYQQMNKDKDIPKWSMGNIYSQETDPATNNIGRAIRDENYDSVRTVIVGKKCDKWVLDNYHSQETKPGLKKMKTNNETDTDSESDIEDLHSDKKELTIHEASAQLKRITCKGPILAQESDSSKKIHPRPFIKSDTLGSVRAELSCSNIDENSVQNLDEMNILKEDQKMEYPTSSHVEYNADGSMYMYI